MKLSEGALLPGPRRIHSCFGSTLHSQCKHIHTHRHTKSSLTDTYHTGLPTTKPPRGPTSRRDDTLLTVAMVRPRAHKPTPATGSFSRSSSSSCRSLSLVTAAGKRWTTQGGEEHGQHTPDKFINRLCRATCTHANREQATWHLRDSPSSFLSNQVRKGHMRHPRCPCFGTHTHNGLCFSLQFAPHAGQQVTGCVNQHTRQRVIIAIEIGFLAGFCSPPLWHFSLTVSPYRRKGSHRSQDFSLLVFLVNFDVLWG